MNDRTEAVERALRRHVDDLAAADGDLELVGLCVEEFPDDGDALLTLEVSVDLEHRRRSDAFRVK